MKIIEAITKFIDDSRYDTLSKAVIDKAKVILLDTIGAGLPGSRTKPGQILTNVIKNLGGKRESTIIGDGTKVNCVQAGYINSYLVDVMDYEEGYSGLGIGHPNASIVPSAIAVGERVNTSGKDIINAIVIGNEVAIRIGLAVWPSKEKWELGGFAFAWQGFGSAAAACKLLHLNKDQMMDAFGFTGSSTSLPTSIHKWERPLHWVKNNFHRQTDAGILGALMAEQGFIGPRDILDSDLGFWRMAGSDRCDFDRMKKGLGEEYEILKEYFKLYPTCRYTHVTLDAVDAIMRVNAFNPEEVDQIKVRASTPLKKWFVDYAPKSLIDAEFSLPFAVAMLILGYKPGLDWLKEETLRNPKVLSMVKKVQVESAPDVGSNIGYSNAAVDVIMKDGRCFSKQVDIEKDSLRGSPENPIDVIGKFRSCASSAGMKEGQAEEIINIIDRLEKVGEISKLTKLLKIA